MMEIESVQSPVWVDDDRTAIKCQVKFAESEAELPFTASANDSETYGRKLFEDLVSGVYGDIADAVPPDPVALAEQQKRTILAGVAEKTRVWGLQYQMGIITPDDLVKLRAWLLYAQDVEAVDTSQGEGINWPVPPAN